jgi:putative ABC transport system ATP-binding protein
MAASGMSASSALASGDAACVELRGVVCAVGSGKTRTKVTLPDLSIARREHTLLIGPSGSGKTTLINAVAGIATPMAGSIVVDGIAMEKKSARERDHLRGKKIGIVMQRLHLIGALTVADNLRMAQRIAGIASGKTDESMILPILRELNIADKANRYPRQLSQGEAQRAAIARALVNRPMLLIADEPTSALDDANAEAAIKLLLDQASKHGATLLVATHDHRIKPYFSRVVELSKAGVSV